MSYLEVFKGVVVEASKFCGVGAGISKLEAGAEAESEKGDSAHLCFLRRCEWYSVARFPVIRFHRNIHAHYLYMFKSLILCVNYHGLLMRVIQLMF